MASLSGVQCMSVVVSELNLRIHARAGSPNLWYSEIGQLEATFRSSFQTSTPGYREIGLDLIVTRYKIDLLRGVEHKTTTGLSDVQIAAAKSAVQSGNPIFQEIARNFLKNTHNIDQPARQNMAFPNNARLPRATE